MIPNITRPLPYERIPYEKDDTVVVRSMPKGIFTLCFPEKFYRGSRLAIDDVLDDETGELQSAARLHTAQKYEVKSVDLATMLLTKWTTDVHFVQYYTPALYRMRKEDQINLPQEIEFRFVAFDLDFENHGRPTPKNYRHLQTALVAFDFTPNIVYATRGGARIIYYIEPIYDAAVFEKHYEAFLKRVSVLDNCPTGYHVDPTCKDWTRMFRAPHVVRDGEPTYDMPVDEFYCMVGKRLDLQTFKVKEKTRAYKTRHNAPFDQNDQYLLTRLGEIQQGSRNDSLFRACCHIFRNYNEQGIDCWLDVFIERAGNEGLNQSEIQQVINSAQKTAGDKK